MKHLLVLRVATKVSIYALELEVLLYIAQQHISPASVTNCSSAANTERK